QIVGGVVLAGDTQKASMPAIPDFDPPRPMIGYGGRAFNLRPELRDEIAGVYLGATAVEAVESIGDLLADFPLRRVMRAG
ncbi:MAG: hypothetical protein ACKO4U_04845, partial [Caldilinea sp.]